MSVGSVLKDALDRNERYMLSAVEGLSPEELRRRPAPESNPLGWLMWHLTRVQDYARFHHRAEGNRLGERGMVRALRDGP